QADAQALDMALATLEHMALGGLYDQLGGGFCRYSVDERWLIPHFEKMLYDNGLLLALYSEAWQVSGRPAFAKAAIETGAWLLREMQAPDGAFYSSLDADSEGHEGRYYVWDRQAVQAALEAEDYAPFARHFGLEQAANFEGQHHLYVAETSDSIAASLGQAARDVEARIVRARAALLAIREQRVRPGRDEKCLTAWNALAIKGLAIAGRVFERPDLLAAADRALGFIRSVMWRDGTLLATCKDGRAHLNAYLDDYVFLIDAVLALLQARWRSEDLAFAQALAEAVLARFEDPEQGGFFYTSHDHERLILRTRSGTDDALPAGAGIAAQVLLRLGSVLGEARYLNTAERALKAHAQAMATYPSAFHTLLHALEDYLLGCETVVLRGSGAALAAWDSRCHRYYAPRRLSLAIPDNAEALPAPLAQCRPEGEVVAYRCQGLQCSAPIKTRAALEAALATGEVRAAPKASS
ncbi:MAG: thioredoxin domain-containing protein, partial [Gammaproteobacteria bacterium]